MISQNKYLLYFSLIVFQLNTNLYGFGKNKVQYENLDWKYSTTPHFHIYQHQNQGDIPKITAYWIEKDYTQLSKYFGFKHRKAIPLIVYNSPNRFTETNIIMELLPEGVGGFTEVFKNRVVLPFTGSYDEYRHVLHHELVHAFQYGILYDQFGGSVLRTAGLQMPLWFAEGTAEYLSSGWNVESDMFLMDKTIYGRLPMPGPEMGGYMAYKGGQSFFHFLEATRGKKKFSKFLKGFRDTKNVEISLKNAFKKPIKELGKEWEQQLRRIYWPEIGRRDEPEHVAEALTSIEKTRSNFNLKPRLSPDGTMIAYFSDHKDYTRIKVVDRKGKTVSEISQYSYGGYFETFHPFRSGMCWSPNNNRIAYVTRRNGDDEIRITNIYNKRNVETINPNLSIVNSPDWSPDGRSIVFTGVKSDRSDLYLYDLESKEITRLTNSIATESDPKFSPDNKGILFSAQDSTGIAYRNRESRFRPVASLHYLDIESKEIIRKTFGSYNAKHACFSSDGENILFVSDKNGIDNLYISPVTSADSMQPVTDFIGGCMNPDWAREDDAIVFCLFQKQAWNIWLMEKPMEHRKDSALALTWWAQCLQDTTLEFFDRKMAIKDSAKIADSLALIKEMSDSTDTNSLESSGIIVEAEPDSADAAHVVSEDSSAIATNDSLDAVQDSTGEKFAEASDSTQDSSETEDVFTFEDLDTQPYRLKFSPDMVSVGLAVNSLYGYGGAGQVVLSDIMGNHRISLAGDIQGRIDEYAHLFGSYLNLQYRLDFGLGAFFNRDYTYSGIYDIETTPTDTQYVEYYYHDTQTGGILFLSFPYSMYMRLDLNSYFSYINRQRYRLENFNLKKDDTPSREFFIIIPSLSATFDNILWGITGPINGIRTQLNLVFSPPVNGIDVDAAFISADIDFRKYFHFMRRFVLATKVAMGGSFSLNDEKPARQFFVGGNENWFFFDAPHRDNYRENIDNIFYSEFIVPFRGWNYLDFTGSRFAVANVEFRFPFVKELSIAWPMPMALRYINGALFTDIGNAWDKEDEFDVLPLPQTIYGGFGFGFRMNLGIFVLRYDHAWGTDWQNFITQPKPYVSLGAEF